MSISQQLANITNENVQRAQVHLKDTDQLQLGERVLIDLSNPLCYMHLC